MGEHMLTLLQSFWAKQLIVGRQGGYNGKPFSASRGVTQGDPVSPTIFNIMFDAIVRYWLSLVNAWPRQVGGEPFGALLH